jgi:PadR family transcriptional regulator, regulatory protein PadR
MPDDNLLLESFISNHLFYTYASYVHIVNMCIGDDMRDEIEKWLKELKKGSTRLCILSLLNSGDRYGYELIQELESRTGGAIILKESNAYPALHSMEEDGLVTSYWKETGEGLPPRKYYKISERGSELLSEMIAEWEKYVQAMENLWRHDDADKR